MAYSSPFRYAAALLLSLALLLGSCCANNVCDRDDSREDNILLRFSIDGSRSFTAAELDTIIIQRYPRKFTPTTKPEVVILRRTSAQARDTIVLNNNTPFAQTGTAKLNRYRYVIQYLQGVPGTRRVATPVLTIDSVQLRGSLEGAACCTYYKNTQKTVFINNEPVGQDLKPNPVLTITKPR
ncbi:hypothetical protein IC235_11765 [Hymenobacter sp. BT664]|uniref:Lipoprotein n=1 Tax=Hymenobacter montanus TaxID=2771359 RepID=A0A927GJJ8_9BACT|nr:hypothetical protein [Hymenobacter montanus]MBD2768563.1 hypothetical protein [Hymenobacter montanus]